MEEKKKKSDKENYRKITPCEPYMPREVSEKIKLDLKTGCLDSLKYLWVRVFDNTN